MAKITLMHLRDSRGIYGADRAVLTLAKHIDRDRFDFVLLCLRSPDGLSDRLIGAARKSGIPVEVLPVRRRLDLPAIRRLRRLLKAYAVSILHAHDFKTTFYALLASANLGISRVATAHGTTRDSLRMKAYLFLDERLVYRFFDRIVAVAHQVSDDLKRTGVGPDKIEVIPNGIDLAGVGSAASPADRNGPVFGVIGRLYPDKGHRFFLRAFRNVVREHPAAKALIVGGGPLEQELERQIRDLGLKEHVTLCGPRLDMTEVYRQLDCVVMPSLREGLPYVLLEALTAGVPVIATTVGDIPRLIRHGQTGFLVPPGSGDALEISMRRILTHPSEAREMARNGTRLVAKEYSATRMVRQTERLYESLLKPCAESQGS